MRKVKKSVRVRKLDLADRVIALVEDARKRVATAANVALVYTYYEVGRMIVEDEQGGKKRAAYGKAQLAMLSRKLTARLGKGWSPTNLEYMRKFFKVYSVPSCGDRRIPQTDFEEFAIGAADSQNGVLEIQSAPISFRLSWSHYLVLMRIENPDERRFYEIEAAESGWGLEELKRQFKSSLYERLALSRDKKGVLELSKRGQVVSKPEDVIKDPYVLEFLGLEEKERYNETELESRIIEHVEQFILEMGKGFILVGRQVRFTFQEKHFRVDLVFYNRILRCFVLVDLKTGELTHGDVGQMMMYVNYYDRKVKLADENPSIGILLCADKDDAIVEMTLPERNRQIFARKYLTVLPDKEALRRLVKKQLGNKREGNN
jgi:Uncharacterized conserved protein